jgi:hypothetical protein
MASETIILTLKNIVRIYISKFCILSGLLSIFKTIFNELTHMTTYSWNLSWWWGQVCQQTTTTTVIRVFFFSVLMWTVPSVGQNAVHQRAYQFEYPEASFHLNKNIH